MDSKEIREMIDRPKMERHQVLRTMFSNKSDCYADTNDEDVVMAVTIDKAVEVADPILADLLKLREENEELRAELKDNDPTWDGRHITEREKLSLETAQELLKLRELIKGDCKYCAYNKHFPSKCEGCLHGISTGIESRWELLALSPAEEVCGCHKCKPNAWNTKQCVYTGKPIKESE